MGACCGGGEAQPGPGDKAPEAGGAPGQKTGQSVISRLSESGSRFVMIKFFNPEDPGMAKVHEAYCNLADEYTDIIFMEADATVNTEAVAELQVKALPSFIAFKAHTEVGRYEGNNMDELKTLVTQLQDQIKR